MHAQIDPCGVGVSVEIIARHSRKQALPTKPVQSYPRNSAHFAKRKQKTPTCRFLQNTVHGILLHFRSGQTKAFMSYYAIIGST